MKMTKTKSYYARSVLYWLLSMFFLYLVFYGLIGDPVRSFLVLLAYILFALTNKHSSLNSQIGRQWKAREIFKNDK